jgi:hypothetical protein
VITDRVLALQSLYLSLEISSDDMLRFYKGSAKEIVANAENGQSVRFPAQVLRSHVSSDGVYGRFRIDFDEASKFVAIHRVGDLSP